jgi:hypothetical protein
MWMPKSEQDILSAFDAGDLIETANFDGKSALPGKGKGKDLAVDVAAMTADGGTLLYGVAEDKNKRLMVPNPFELAGARERVDQIVQTSISEPPTIEVHTIPTGDDPSLGYLVIAVLPSPRAPHMVIVGKEHRYYGRGATGNVLLSEGDVARLYERRRRWEVDRNDMLDEAIESAPIPPHEGYGFLHLVARPVVPDEDLFDRAQGEQHVADFLYGLFSAAISEDVYSINSALDLSLNKSYERRADGWAASEGLDAEEGTTVDPGYVLNFEIGLDGGGRLFCGRAAEEYRGRLLVFENVVARLTTRFLAVLGGLYAAADYFGPVDAGLAVTGLDGGISHWLSQQILASPRPYVKDQYRRTGRFSAIMLKDDPRGAARKLVLPLARALTTESYDPFSR